MRALRVKTFFRRGMAKQVCLWLMTMVWKVASTMPQRIAQAMGWYEKALGDFDSALVLEPQNQRSRLGVKVAFGARSAWTDPRHSTTARRRTGPRRRGSSSRAH